MPATTPHPHAPPTWRVLLVAALALCLAAAALAAMPAGSADAAPEAPSQAQQCIEATNRAHVEAGRATRRVLTVRAVGSNDHLGSIYGSSTLEQTAPGRWSRVERCAPGTTTTTAPGSSTTTTEGPGDRPPLTERYTAVHETDSRLPGHTVYRPQNLGAVSDPMPIVVWGNGACRADGTMFREFLQPLAAHGVLVIASGRPGGSGSTNADMLIDAIDFAVAENGRQGSQYQGRLDVDSISAMGQSCGGLEAIDASRDPRVGSTILWNSGIFTSGGIGGVGKDALNRLHSPVAWLNGGPSDIAYSNAVDDYERVPNSVPAVFGAYGNVGHSAMFTNPAIEREIIGVAADWLDATLYDDATARAQFVGPNCGLCSGTEWAMRSKNWP
jgi:hypothetical protein